MDKENLYEFVSKKTERCKILVVGDVMLDKYYYGDVVRISHEAPVPINHVTSEKDEMGGAANGAHNLSLLGCQTSIAGFVGEDYHCQTLLDKFTAQGLDYRGLVRTNHPTTTKMRVIGGHQQMMRIDFEDTSAMDNSYVERLLNYISQRLNESLDALVLSDYGKGVCTEYVCQRMIKEAHAHGVPVIVAPKGNNWAKYAHADYITANLKMINAVLIEPIRNLDDAVERTAHYLMRKYKLKNVLATRSEKGVSMISEDFLKHIPTKAQDIFDVSGAADTVLAVFSLALAGGMKKEESAYLANLAASIVIGKLGTYAVSKAELLEALEATMAGAAPKK